MLKKLLMGLAMLTSVSMYAVPTLNVYNFEVKMIRRLLIKA